MKRNILFLMVLISITTNAIDFAPIGAIWFYSELNINPSVITYKTIESIADTIIAGKDCKKLKVVTRYWGTPETSYRFMYSKNDSIFEYDGNSFRLLYDFGANQGDTIIIDQYHPEMIINSTSTININGRIRKVQNVTCSDGMMFEFGGTVIEGIGNLNFMFPTYDMNFDGPLRCYEDSIIGSYINPRWNSIDCEKVITEVDKITFPEIIIYFDQISKCIRISGVQGVSSYKLVDMQGRKIKSGEVYKSKVVNVDDIPRGSYFLQLGNVHNKLNRKLILN